MNPAPFNTHVLYLTKQNKRLQDFLYDDLDKGELIPPQPIVDMTKSTSTDFYALSKNFGGRYVCSVEKLVYNVGGRKFALETNSRNALQWKMGIPDDLFTGQQIKNSISSVVVLLDEYTMISPPLLHKMLHCVSMLFDSPTVLIMGGDRFQLGPINWDASSDKNYRDEHGREAPADAVTQNNQYYVSDVREELQKRLKQEPFEYHMVGSQRCRNDPGLAKLIVYLRNACQNRTSIKAVERRLVAFGHSRGIPLFRCEPTFYGCKSGQLVFKNEQQGNSDGDLDETNVKRTGTDDDADEDRHLGDDDLRDTTDIDIDWNTPPIVDMHQTMSGFRSFYHHMF